MSQFDGPTTAAEWVDCYHRLGLTGVYESGGCVLMPLDLGVTALHMPRSLGEKVVAELRERLPIGPLLARSRHGFERYTFFGLRGAEPDAEAVAELDQLGVSIGGRKSSVLLPQSLEPGARAPYRWIRPPESRMTLPTVSEIVCSTGSAHRRYRRSHSGSSAILSTTTSCQNGS